MTCDPYIWNGTKACPYPNYGNTPPTTDPDASPRHYIHTSFFHHIFGTSGAAEVTSTILILIGLALFIRCIGWPIARLVLEHRDHRRLQQDRPITFLEITPPAVTTKSLLATAQWQTEVRGMLSSNTRTAHMLQRKNILSLEIVGTRREGIRFIAALDPDDVTIFTQQLISYQHDVKFQEVEDYLPIDLASGGYEVRIMDFKQIGHLVHSIAIHDKPEQHDPMTFILGAMNDLQPGELIAWQIIESPASSRVTNRLRRQLLHGKDTTIRHAWWYYAFMLLWLPVKAVSTLLHWMLEAVGEEISGVRTPPRRYDYTAYQASTITPETQHKLDAIHAKLDQPQFNVDIRAIVIGPNSRQRAQGISNSLHQFGVPGYQGLVTRSNIPNKWLYPYRLTAFSKRLPSKFTRNSNVLAADEVASLYHFPYSDGTSNANVVTSYSKSLAAPVSMKASADDAGFDVVLGINRHNGNITPVGLTREEREKHVYIVGGTGNGKTTMLSGAIMQDIIAGKGVAIIDPHGDMAQDILSRIPESRIKDVVFFDPHDIAHPVGLNLLELTPGLVPDELALQKDFLMEAIVSIFRKVFSEDDTGGHRVEATLRNAILTAFSVPDATLFTLYDLLTDPDFRKSVVAKLDNKRLKQYWENKVGKAGNMQLVKMTDGVTTKLERFDASEAIRRVIEQPKSTIDFDDIINSGKILICKFGKGAIGNDTAELFGITIMAKLQLAAQRRIHIKPSERKPFYLYVDEFQTFATLTFVEMLAEARKFKLYMTMAEQSTAQQEEQRIVHIILDNVGTIICFRFGSPRSEALLLPLFKPFLDPGEISKLPSFNFYMSARALRTQEPLSGETVPLADDGSEQRAEQVIAASQEQYTTTYVASVAEQTEPAAGQSSKAAPTSSKAKTGSTSTDKPATTRKSGITKPPLGKSRKKTKKE